MNARLAQPNPSTRTPRAAQPIVAAVEVLSAEKIFANGTRALDTDRSRRSAKVNSSL